ncbi:M3 family oligoendopeptidase [Fictibacillus nanhaiensis]|uniref:M3 family oligoendopeptidase n=1 Tax=Fictibacillus nanhaiensis TaxID=742169 RepID=UPI001C93E8E8|nr:M3 family oligoendopeptidase [Fictibacillus nanhaiensis]MBY6037465.1 M3 family oligoendopeptidase [Fictibacillus nanhaiensis]
MKFSEFTYERPNVTELKTAFEKAVQIFREASSADQQNEAMKKVVDLRNGFESKARLAKIRHTINTEDVFYKDEQAFMDENLPVYQGMVTAFHEALVQSPYKDELEKKWGSQLFRLAELKVKTYSEDVLEDLKQENKLSSEYVKVMASAKIEFDGKELNLAQLAPYIQSSDRDTRQAAYQASNAFLKANEEKFDAIYDDLVKLRTRIAKKLGYNQFTELAYDRMGRTDYNAQDVKVFRQQVKEIIVPLCTKLKKSQQKRIGLNELKYYDESFSFTTGNPVPQGDAEWIVEKAKQVFSGLSQETGAFFTYMADDELMDLESKKGKAPGGYCTYLQDYQAPFIFTNFTGSENDVRVLLHEIGHAFQMYTSRGYEVPEYQFPTLEACEIHSMSMEFLTYPWIDKWFEKDTEKYLYSHLTGALEFIPYGVAVDEFQHFVYDHPDATPRERREKWSELEKMYLPHRDYDGLEYLENGGFWHRQGHIFRSPFYYIDYTLAQICALQFWKRSVENREQAWEDYFALCQKGGSLPFTKLVEEAGLVSPFEKGCVASVVGEVERFIATIDENQFIKA